MGIKTVIMILASLSFSISAFADHHMDGEKKPFSINGDFATSLQLHSNENRNAGNNHDDFNVDLIEINIEKNWSQSKLHLSIGYGSTANAVNAAGTQSVNTLNVMNAYYHMHTSYGLGLSVGKFESPVGHETYNQMDNSQFTRSYGFMLAPYFSTGLNFNYAQDMWAVGLIVSNGQGRDVDTGDNNKTMAITIDVDPMENLSFDLNYVTGTEATLIGGANTAAVTREINILDFSAAYMINEMFDVALNYIDHGQKLSAGGTDNKATSLAAYVNANLGMFGLGLRYEQFTYDSGIAAYNGPGTVFAAPVGTDNTISSITLSAKAEIDQNAMVILEYRMDNGDDTGTFVDEKNVATDSQNTITAGLMYRF